MWNSRTQNRGNSFQDLTSNMVISTFYLSHFLTSRKLYSYLCTWNWVSWSNLLKHCQLRWLFQLPHFSISSEKKNQSWCVWWFTDSATYQRWSFLWDNVKTWKEGFTLSKLSLKYMSKEPLYRNYWQATNTWLQHDHQDVISAQPICGLYRKPWWSQWWARWTIPLRFEGHEWTV